MCEKSFSFLNTKLSLCLRLFFSTVALYNMYDLVVPAVSFTSGHEPKFFSAALIFFFLADRIVCSCLSLSLGFNESLPASRCLTNEEYVGSYYLELTCAYLSTTFGGHIVSFPSLQFLDE